MSAGALRRALHRPGTTSRGRTDRRPSLPARARRRHRFRARRPVAPTRRPERDVHVHRRRGLQLLVGDERSERECERHVRATPPTSTMTFPAAGPYNTAGWNASAGCSAQSICGTAQDNLGGSGVQDVQVSIQRGNGNYWNGSSFGSTSPFWNIASGTTSWSLAFPASNLPADGTYTVTVSAVDNDGNIQTTTSPIAIFTYDTTPPGVSITSVNGAAQRSPIQPAATSLRSVARARTLSRATRRARQLGSNRHGHRVRHRELRSWCLERDAYSAVVGGEGLTPCRRGSLTLPVTRGRAGRSRSASVAP